MIPELGQFAALLALAVALIQGSLPIVGAARGNAAWMQLARPAAQTQCLLVVVAFACLTASFVNNDWSVLYVASNSNSALPLADAVCSDAGMPGSCCSQRSACAASRPRTVTSPLPLVGRNSPLTCASSPGAVSDILPFPPCAFG